MKSVCQVLILCYAEDVDEECWKSRFYAMRKMLMKSILR